MSNNQNTIILEDAYENMEIEIIQKVGGEVVAKRSATSWESAEEEFGKLQRHSDENILSK